MSAYPPPRENVPIFDSTLFGFRSGNLDIGGGGGLTEEEMDNLYVKYPISQASGETFNGTTILTNTLSVAGPTTLQSTLSVAQDLTLGQDILMTNPGSYIRFPDATQQTIAFQTLTPNPAGIYIDANIQVNAYGQVTSASSASTENNLISRVVLTPATLPIGIAYPIVCPVGTKIVEVILCSGGGLQGTNALDTGTDTMYAGGSGASGCCAILAFEMSPPPYTIGTNNYLVAEFLPPTLPGQSVGVGLGWSNAAISYFGAFLPISLILNSICLLGGGLAGGNASIGTPGAGGVNASLGNQVSIAMVNNSLSTVYAQGQNGSSLPPIPNFTTCPFTTQPTPTCPLADFNPISTILEPLITGGYSEYSSGSITTFAQGTGGIILSFFT